MRSIRIATILAALTVGAASVSAQSTTPPTSGSPTTTTAARHASPARDSLRAIRQSSKQLMADRKAAKASGDTERVKADSKALRANHQQAQRLSKGLPHRKHAPRKTPPPPKP